MPLKLWIVMMEKIKRRCEENFLCIYTTQSMFHFDFVLLKWNEIIAYMYVCNCRQVHRAWQESQWLNLNPCICMCYAEALKTCLVQWYSVNHMQFAEITRWWLVSGIREGTAELVHHSNVECNLAGYQSIDIIRLEWKPLEMISVKWSAKM